MASIHLANSNSTSNPSANPTPEQDRDTQLLGVGRQCSDPSCYLVDFLPFKCQHCELSFCQEHFKVDVHHCTKYDESKHNRVAPNCPLCNIPVAVRPGQDPNERMDRHLETECSIVTGKVQAKTTPLCARGNCRKVLFSPIRCTSCRQQFCPAHRFPGDHTCSASSTASPVKPTLSSANTISNLNTTAKNINTKATAAGTAAMGAMKKGIANVSASAQQASTTAKTATAGPSKPSKPLPFSKMDRLSNRSSPVLTTASESAIVSTTATNDVSTANVSISLPQSHETTATTATTTPPNNDVIKPAPVIDIFSWNFIPRPIFASA
ncbi:hypothetical protein D9619_007151 [Psilocybe cf. subviscida]|uniref:AN1-type domain-containing protein n=1 Tax=Psilocybe cf. subviscida TaxID=2480587 RepID=A0A8H5B210_9AGAR|nr:hypothetical protein D9619_007151 [Psilocybe cf. subviscida]